MDLIKEIQPEQVKENIDIFRIQPDILGGEDLYWSEAGMTELTNQYNDGDWAPNALLSFTKTENDVWLSVTLFGKYRPEDPRKRKKSK